MVASTSFADPRSLPPSGLLARNNFRLARNPSRVDAKCGDHLLQVDLPGLNARDVHFMIGSLPLTDGARPSRDVKTIIARSVDGRIQDYSKGGHHDSDHWCTTKQRAGRCYSSVSEGECSGSGTYRIAQAHQRDKVARTRNGYRCIPRSTARDDAGARALLGNRV